MAVKTQPHRLLHFPDVEVLPELSRTGFPSEPNLPAYMTREKNPSLSKQDRKKKPKPSQHGFARPALFPGFQNAPCNHENAATAAESSQRCSSHPPTLRTPKPLEFRNPHSRKHPPAPQHLRRGAGAAPPLPRPPAAAPGRAPHRNPARRPPRGCGVETPSPAATPGLTPHEGTGRLPPPPPSAPVPGPAQDACTAPRAVAVPVPAPHGRRAEAAARSRSAGNSWRRARPGPPRRC